MTDTEKLLQEACDIASRTFDVPTQATVMALFQRLCDERDRIAWLADAADDATVH